MCNIRYEEYQVPYAYILAIRTLVPQILVPPVQLPHPVLLQKTNHDDHPPPLLPQNPRPGLHPNPHPIRLNSPVLLYLAILYQVEEFYEVGVGGCVAWVFLLCVGGGLAYAGDYEGGLADVGGYCWGVL